MSFGKKVIIALLVIAALGEIGLVSYNVLISRRQARVLDKYIEKQAEREAEELKKEDEFIEDGAVIADVYEIKSTTEISDAYIKDDPSGLSEQDRKTYDTAKEILERETKGCTTAYEKEKKIFEWMCDNIKQDYSASTMALLQAGESLPQDTPYGVLHGKVAVCVGYATTFRLFMNMLGLECHIPHSESHSWDLVKLDDDHWYYVDVYKGASWGSVNYQYFNMNEAVEAMNEEPVGQGKLPRADGAKYIYPVSIAKEAKDVTDIPKLVKKAIDKKTPCIGIRFKTNPDEDGIRLAEQVVDSIYNRLMNNHPEFGNSSITYNWYADESDKYVLAVYYIPGDTGSSADVDEKLAEKISKLLTKYFGEGYDSFTTDSSQYVETTNDGEVDRVYATNAG